MNLGAAIETARKRRGFRQQDFAEMCKLSQSYLSQIENNKKEPNLSILKRISSVLDIPLPLIFFLSMDDHDIQPDKRQAYKMISPSINSFLQELFLPKGK